MLSITIPGGEYWDESKEEFCYVKDRSLQLEHSLVSLSKWESKWKKPFLFTNDKTYEETLDYIKCMTITQNVDPSVYNGLTTGNMNQIIKYINDPMTATTFPNDRSSKSSREIVTAELIYYWMISLQIPFECQRWHLNRLLTLIRVCNVKNTPPKKMSKRDIMRQNDALNAARRKRLNTRG